MSKDDSESEITKAMINGEDNYLFTQSRPGNAGSHNEDGFGRIPEVPPFYYSYYEIIYTNSFIYTAWLPDYTFKCQKKQSVICIAGGGRI
jgi:hypothetical protein